MTYVGGRYEYDIFVSYSHGVTGLPGSASDAEPLRDWSRKLAEDLCKVLATSLNQRQPPDRRLTYYLDRYDLQSAVDLRKRLREAAGKAAVLLFLASDYALLSEWCQVELDGFRAAAKQDGRDRESIVLREVIKTSADLWPAWLKGEGGLPPFSSTPFYDPDDHSSPFGLIEFQQTERISGLHNATRELKLELQQKLVRQRELEELARPQAPDRGDRPIVFLQSDTRNSTVWSRVKDQMQDTFVVNPDRLEDPDADDGFALRSYPRRKQEFLRYSEGLVLLRAQPDDDMGLEYAKAMYDRRQARVAVKVAGLDTCPGPGGGGMRLGEVPWVYMGAEGWKAELLAALGL